MTRALREAIGVVTGFDDPTVMGQPVEQPSRHLRIPEHGGPFGEWRDW